jgi:stress response protein YsnF
MKSKDLEDLQEQLEIKKRKITKEDVEKVKIVKTKTKDVSTFDGFD